MPASNHDSWQAYLAGLSGTNGELANALWKEVGKLSTGSIPVPQAGSFDNGFEFVWDDGNHHLEADIFSDEHIEWFYLNRATKATDSGEYFDDGIFNGYLNFFGV